ncbi:phosphatidylinositol phosphate synthase [Lapillicoccus jejuensis]|uniref:Phosphatidylinositol phosphate synthase n=1 Tax=Lapillicoccus jejuensis TaxID=402171 RepID=A0A542E5B2_9MICO|nr:CDP-alcohol phosphatidyltransferase family protein [Lapillicoccus jejuensis]TQJ10476.1 CDP-diacylglycerol--glycerol-3-phosphate 3-phosphatidyltransferase [Lapillicoccus jejuensis]
MLNRALRETWTKVMTPPARLFLAMGLSPDVVTVVGTIGVCVGALAFYPLGHFFWGTLVVVLFIFSDNVDGVMARMQGRQGVWGAFLDSTLDRVGDAAIFGGLVIAFARSGPMNNLLYAGLALACLILGMVVSYAKARAEGLGLTANVGIAERADRLLLVLTATGLVGLGLPVVVLGVVLAVLAVASLVTVVQRMLTVRRQALAAVAGHDPRAS